jgi:hypothetical protein
MSPATSGAMTAHNEIQNSDVTDDGMARALLQPPGWRAEPWCPAIHCGVIRAGAR